MSTTVTPTPAPVEEHRPKPWVRLGLTLLMLSFAAFWIWALFFASKEAVNKLDDGGVWAAQAEQRCLTARQEMLELTDLRSIIDVDAALIRERADIVDKATDILERMLDDIVAVVPSSEKGRAIVPMWEADYREYLTNRRQFADQLRATGENLPFYESRAGRLPITERIATFAGDNEMSTCSPPNDLSR
jgi:hypothetical protein